MKTRNILYKGLFSVAILAMSVAPASAEGSFSHPPIGNDPHGNIGSDNPHHKSSEGSMGKHGSVTGHKSFSGHGNFSGHGSTSAHSSFSGHGRSSGHGFSFGHGKSGSFSEKNIKKKLHLDSEQSKKMHQLFMEYRKGTILKTANLRIAQIELDEAVGGGNFDMAAIENKAKQKESAATELTMIRVQALAKAKTFLSEDQFKKFIGMVAHQGGRYGKSGAHHGKKSSKHHSSKSKSKHHGSSGMGGSPHGGFGASEGY